MLFNFNSPRERHFAHEAREDLNLIDQLIANADADQLRNIIDGITWAIPTE